MPCFEGLFGEPFEAPIQNLLFTMAAWHAFAKLRMHTDQSLAVFEALTTILGTVVRYFAKHVCEHIKVNGIPKEPGSRQHESKKKDKDFNLFTSKWHDLTHAADMVRRYGP